MFLTLKNEKTLKKMRSKTLKNNIFFILGRNLIIRSFEIPHSIWKLHKDFKSVFVFKFRQKTKKFTPKWQKPLFEKRVYIVAWTNFLLELGCLGDVITCYLIVFYQLLETKTTVKLNQTKLLLVCVLVFVILVPDKACLVLLLRTPFLGLKRHTLLS